MTAQMGRNGPRVKKPNVVTSAAPQPHPGLLPLLSQQKSLKQARIQQEGRAFRKAHFLTPFASPGASADAGCGPGLFTSPFGVGKLSCGASVSWAIGRAFFFFF